MNNHGPFMEPEAGPAQAKTQVYVVRLPFLQLEIPGLCTF